LYVDLYEQTTIFAKLVARESSVNRVILKQKYARTFNVLATVFQVDGLRALAAWTVKIAVTLTQAAFVRAMLVTRRTVVFLQTSPVNIRT